MPLQRVHFAEEVPEVFRASLQAIRRELEVPAEFPAEVVRGRADGGREPAAARAGPDRPRVRHDRSAGLDGPRPGAAHRAQRRRVHRALRDRRRRGVRAARRPDRRRGAQARRDPLRAGQAHPAAPAGAVRGRGLAAARRGPARAAVDDPGRRVRRRHGRDLQARAGEVAREAELRRRTEGPRRRYGVGVAAAAARGRQAPGAARTRTRRRQPPDPGPGDRHLQRRLEPGVPRAAAGRGLERADLAAHRDGAPRT